MSVNCGAFEVLTRGLAVVDCIEDVSGVVTYVNLIVCTNEHLIFPGLLVGLLVYPPAGSNALASLSSL